jgi:hypothetical protein
VSETPFRNQDKDEPFGTTPDDSSQADAPAPAADDPQQADAPALAPPGKPDGEVDTRA